MPRKPEPSFELKRIIWEVAATVGKDRLTAIGRQVEIELRKDPNMMEELVPDVRTIEKIIADINALPREIVLAKLPTYVWSLRNDYDSLRSGDPFTPHSRKVFYFGQQLRDRLYIEIPSWFPSLSLVEQDPNIMLLWNRVQKPVTQNNKEEAVEKEWGDSGYDARSHSLFDMFRRHLAGHDFSDVLDLLERKASNYRTACLEAYADTQKELEPLSKRMTEQGLQAMAKHVFFESSARAQLVPVLDIDEEELEEDRTILPDGSISHPNIEKWFERRHTVDYSASLVEVERQLIATLPDSGSFSNIRLSKYQLEEVTRELRRLLSPDARLKEWVLSGRCDFCP